MALDSLFFAMPKSRQLTALNVNLQNMDVLDFINVIDSFGLEWDCVLNAKTSCHLRKHVGIGFGRA